MHLSYLNHVQFHGSDRKKKELDVKWDPQANRPQLNLEEIIVLLSCLHLILTLFNWKLLRCPVAHHFSTLSSFNWIRNWNCFFFLRSFSTSIRRKQILISFFFLSVVQRVLLYFSVCPFRIGDARDKYVSVYDLMKRRISFEAKTKTINSSYFSGLR